MALKVYYPLGGKHRVLRYQTHSRGGHIIVTPCRYRCSSHQVVIKSAMTIIEHLSNRASSFSFTDYLEVEIVAPSAIRCAVAEEIDHANKIKDFLTDVCCSIAECLINPNYPKQPLPPEFKLCPNPVVGKYHWTCQDDNGNDTCVAGIQLSNITPEKLFEKYSSAWDMKYPKQKYLDNKEVVSRAEQAKDHESLWMAGCDFGAHRNGVFLRELEHDEFFSETVLFYFRNPKILDLTEFNNIYTSHTVHIQDKEDRVKKELIEAKSKKRQEDVNNILEIFGRRQ